MGKKGPKPRPLRDRVMERVIRSDGCWEWTGYIMTNGYGKLTHQEDISGLAHRLVYHFEVGPIPEGFELDHLCRNRGCVNPEHLDVVTRRVNINRSPLVRERRKRQKYEALGRRLERLENSNANKFKTHCPQGHPYSPENTRWYRNGRRCRECERIRARAAYWRRKEVGP